MGAMDFTQTVKGKNAQEAFNTAHDAATYIHGHGGYSGTLAEKGAFRMIERKPDMTIGDQITALEQKSEFPFIDKWGPAGCLAHDDHETYTFFGIASS